MPGLREQERGRVIPFPAGGGRSPRMGQPGVNRGAVARIGQATPMDWCGASYHDAAIESAKGDRDIGATPGRF